MVVCIFWSVQNFISRELPFEITIITCKFNIIGCYNNALRLVSGPTELEGTVEVCVNNLWGLIGDAGWDDTDAVVVCRQLGLPTGGNTEI